MQESELSKMTTEEDTTHVTKIFFYPIVISLKAEDLLKTKRDGPIAQTIVGPSPLTLPQ